MSTDNSKDIAGQSATSSSSSKSSSSSPSPSSSSSPESESEKSTNEWSLTDPIAKFLRWKICWGYVRVQGGLKGGKSTISGHQYLKDLDQVGDPKSMKGLTKLIFVFLKT